MVLPSKSISDQCTAPGLLDKGTVLRHQAAVRSFRYEDEPVASVFRVVNDDGNQILQVRRNANYKRVRAAWLFFQWTAAATTLLLLISALLFALVRAPAKTLRPDEEDPWRTMCHETQRNVWSQQSGLGMAWVWHDQQHPRYANRPT